MIQLQVLNKIIQNRDPSLILLNNLNETFFSDYPDEFKYILDHYNQFGVIPDKETFIGKFNDFDFIQVNEPDAYLINELYNDRNKRELAVVFNKMRTLLMNNDINEATKLFKETSEKMSESVHLDAVDIFKDTSRFQDYVDRSQDFGKFYISTGFKELDDVLGGWDREDELATIVARTNQGKSWILLKTALAAAEQGLKVGLYSGEMSVRKVGYRIDTLLGHISNSAMIRGNLDIHNQYEKYIQDLKDGKVKGTIKVLTPDMISGPAGVTALRAFIEKEKLDMLCIDQHSLLEDDRKAKNPVEKAANISRDLKNLQVMERIPIIAVSQQNRNSTENGVDTTHIAQSDRIGQDSTVILNFEQDGKVLTMHILKSRDSVVGKKLQYAIDLDKGVFEYLPATNDANGGAGADQIRSEFCEDGEDVF